MKIVTLILAISIVTLFAISHSSQAQAMPEPAICLARQMSGTGGGPTVSLAVASEHVPFLEAKGFVVQPCNGQEQERAALHADACELAEEAPAKVQAYFAEKYGVTPAELCAVTGEAAGG